MVQLIPRFAAASTCLRRACYSSTSTVRDGPVKREPLRILFCGSDEFSAASLKPLVDIHRLDNLLIESIDVLCRPDKRVGAGLKRINQAPLKIAARDIGLPIHQIDSFSQYDPTKFGTDINLIVAVSFGLLIPAQVIGSAKYGGLNVHPSLLPDLRGAAPIHYALLNRRNHTGVSVQTLHPTKFDHGQIIAQTALPGIPIPAGSTPASLLPVLAEEGATLLKKVIESGAYLPPTQTSRLSEEDILRVTNGEGIVKAPRFRKSDMRIDWDQMTAADIALRRLVFGRLWDDRIYHALSDAEQPTRIMFDDLKDVSKEFESIRAITGELETGLPWAIGSNSGELRLLIPTAGNSMIEVVSCTIASKKTGLGKPELLRILTK